MAESTCLLRSFSNPTVGSCVAEEGDPIRLLGESISFGRFMSESLAWEKWSTFSRNHYVEEAIKFSKPGYVAEKKAYFEAHYRKKAAEKAVALVQEAKTSANGTFDSETEDGNCNNSITKIKSNEDSNVTVSEHLNIEGSNYQIDYTDKIVYNCDIEQCEVGISRLERAEDAAQVHIDTNLNVENSILVDNSNQFENVEVCDNIEVPKERRPDPGTGGLEILASLSPVKGEKIQSSPILSTKTGAAKLSYSLVDRKAAVQPKDGINSLSKGTGGMEILASLSPVKGRKQSSPKLSSKTGAAKLPYSLVDRKAAVQPRDGINSPSKSKKSVGDTIGKNRLTTWSLHMSINSPPPIDETRKTSPVFEQNRIKKSNPNLPNISKGRSVSSRTSTRTSNGLFNQASANSKSPDKRTGRLLNKSLAGGVTANAKVPFLSIDCQKSSSTARGNPRSPTKSSPFRFRSEERAAKRKERMDEIKAKEAEKLQLQRRCKDKAVHDHKKLWHSSDNKPKLNEDRNGGLQSPSNHMRKISLTRPRSPKVGRKVSSTTVQGKNSQNSWKPPISINNSKRVPEKTNQTTTLSVTSLSENITRENASPNIQR